ncbi:MAG: hypothetical protein ACYS9X_15775 [Planctomycetota bacterium]|jgi:hypothetical protein
MGIGDWISGLFGSRNMSLDSVTVTDLENEKIRLETEQEKLVKGVRKIEERKKRLFESGASKSSLMEKRVIAVQIKQLDEEGKDLTRAQAVLSKQIMVIGKVHRIKKREKLLRGQGLWGRISGMDPAEVEGFMMNLKVEARQGDAVAERLMGVLGEDEQDDVAADPEIDEIVKAMESASYGGTAGESVAEAGALSDDEPREREPGEGS